MSVRVARLMVIIAVIVAVIIAVIRTVIRAVIIVADIVSLIVEAWAMFLSTAYQECVYSLSHTLSNPHHVSYIGASLDILTFTRALYPEQILR